ncbi:MAG: hypothetical protein ACWGQW_21910 [bacterium]
MKSRRRITYSIASLACILSIACFVPGCGDDDDDNGTPPAPPQQTASAYNFTEANMEQAAADAVDAISPFNDIAGLMLQIIQTLATPAVPQIQSVVIGPVPIVGVCQNEPAGSVSYTLDDADNSLTPTPGDTVSLTFTNCDLDGMGAVTNGTVTSVLTLFTPSTFPPLFSQATMDVTFNLTSTETVNGSTITETYAASFTFDAQQTTDIDGSVTFTGGNITVTGSDGTNQMGCFTITFAYGSTSYDMAVDAVVNLNGLVMTVSTTNYVGEAEPLLFFQIFPEPTYPDGGALFLFSGGTCADAGVPDGVPDATDLSVYVGAIPGVGDLGPDDIQLLLIEVATSNTLAEIFTTWSALGQMIL